jgi:hypothetical protein
VPGQLQPLVRRNPQLPLVAPTAECGRTRPVCLAFTRGLMEFCPSKHSFHSLLRPILVGHLLRAITSRASSTACSAGESGVFPKSRASGDRIRTSTSSDSS